MAGRGDRHLEGAGRGDRHLEGAGRGVEGSARGGARRAERAYVGGQRVLDRSSLLLHHPPV